MSFTSTTSDTIIIIIITVIIIIEICFSQHRLMLNCIARKMVITSNQRFLVYSFSFIRILALFSIFLLPLIMWFFYALWKSILIPIFSKFFVTEPRAPTGIASIFLRFQSLWIFRDSSTFSFSFWGPPVVARRVLQNRVCPSVLPSFRLSRGFL